MDNLQNNLDTSTSDDDLSKHRFRMLMQKFSIYFYLTLRRQGLFDRSDKSAVEIARDYQVEMLAKNTLERQQKRLVSKLLAVEEDATMDDPMDMEEPSVVIDQQVCHPSADVEELESPPLQTEREKENLKIMQALTRMKVFVNRSMAVPISTVHDLLAPLVGPTKPVIVFGSPPLIDSGLDTYNTNTQTSSMSCGKVSTRDLGKIMKASRCNEILSKSVDVVLKELENVVSKNDLSVYENWEGSYFEMSLSIINQIVAIFCQENEENQVRTKCSEFTQRVIADLLSFEGMDNVMQKLKYYFLMQFVDNIYVCYDTINYLFEQLIKFETYAKNPKCRHMIPIHTIENSFYIFQMLKALLSYYTYEIKAQQTTKTVVADTSCKEWLMGWGNLFGHESDNVVEEPIEKQSTAHWKSTSNQLITSFTDTFPLHANFALELLEILL